MKRIISVFLAVIMIATCFSVVGFAANLTVKAGDNLTNYVWTKAVCSDGTVYKKTVDSNGNTTKLVADYPDDDADCIITYKYDSKGRITKYTNDYYRARSTETYSYNSKGLLSSMKGSNSCAGEFDNYKTTYTYNSKGLCTKTTTKGEFGDRFGSDSYTDTTSYTYNSKGYVTKIVIKGDGNSETVTYTYDSSNRLTKVSSSGTNYGDKFVDKISYSYDSNGRVSKEAVYEYKYGSGSNYTRSYTYDKMGRVTSVKSSSEGITNYTYNSYGDVTKVVTRYSSGSSSTTTYSYTYKKLSKPICKTSDGITLSSYSYNYDGKAKKPVVNAIKDSAHDASLSKSYGEDYYVLYSNNVKTGTAKATVIYYNGHFKGYKTPVTISYTIKDATKVTTVKASNITSSSVTLSWNKVSGAKSYEIYKYVASEKKYVKIGTSSSTSYTAKKLKSKTTYKFAIKAVKSNGSKTGYSLLKTVTTK